MATCAMYCAVLTHGTDIASGSARCGTERAYAGPRQRRRGEGRRGRRRRGRRRERGGSRRERRRSGSLTFRATRLETYRIPPYLPTHALCDARYSRAVCWPSPVLTHSVSCSAI
eukprot:1744523-Rhodomonas_salina.2